jgi:translation initiation factor 2 gamma subunit (eIF-2gamma)
MATQMIFPSFMVKKPGIPEMDFSGVIAGGNLDETDFKVGDEVYGLVPSDLVIR